MTTLTPKERLQLQVDIYRDLITQGERDIKHYEGLLATEVWAATSLACAKARKVTYELVANKLQEILDEWTEEEDDRN